MEINYNYNNGTILKFLRKVLNEINKQYVDSGMRTAFLLKRYIEKYKTDSELGPQHVLLCMMKDIGLFYMNGEVPDDDPALAAASSYTFLEHCSPLGVAARPLLFYKAKYIETQSNDDYDLGLLMTLLNDVVICIYEAYTVEEIEDYLKDGKAKGYFKPDQVKKVIKLLKDEDDILPKLTSESNLYVFETQKYISSAGFTDEELEKFIDTTSFAFEFHNHETLAHTVTTAEIAEALALKCRLTPEMAAIIKIAARVHDIGKIRVPREVLCYPGRLEGEMLAEMQRHVVYTREIIEGSFSYKIVEIAANHHEKLDGSGYPKGLKAIDLSSGDKVIAVADICSALYCRRSYKAAFDDDKIKDIILSDAKAGKLDQRIVNHLIDNFDEIMAKAKEEEAKVLEKYENMKAEYEALTKSSALRHFFDYIEIPEEVTEEAPTEEAPEEINADAQVTEEFLEGVSSSNDEYVAPDEMFTEDELYTEEEEVVYVDENGNVIEDYVPEETEESSIDEFDSFVNDIPEASEEAKEPEADEFESFLDSIPEAEEPKEEATIEVVEEAPIEEDTTNYRYKVKTINADNVEETNKFETYSDALYYAANCWKRGEGGYSSVIIKEDRETIYTRNNDMRADLWETPDDIDDFAYDHEIDYDAADMVLAGKITLDDAINGNYSNEEPAVEEEAEEVPAEEEIPEESVESIEVSEETIEPEVDEFESFLDSIPEAEESQEEIVEETESQEVEEAPEETEVDEFDSFINSIPDAKTEDDPFAEDSSSDPIEEDEDIDSEDEDDEDDEDDDDDDDEDWDDDEDDDDDDEDWDEDEDDDDDDWDEDEDDDDDEDEDIDDEIYDDEEWQNFVKERKNRP